MLRWRILLGTLFIAALAGLCWLDAQQISNRPAGAWLFPLALLLSLAASGEMLWLFGTRDRYELPTRWLVYAGNLAIVAANAGPIFWPEAAASTPLNRIAWPAAVFVGTMLVGFVEAIVRYEQPGRSLIRLALAMLSLAYVGLLLSFVVQLRVISPAAGLTPLVSLIAVVKMGDTGAYTVGRMIGRHKLIPGLSPGKTWEGAVGAMLFAGLAGWLVFWLLPPAGVALWPIRFRWEWVGYGLLVGVAGLLGDLAESLLKRDAGRKDSSPWMPGFGGLLDLLDSILFAAPVAWACWAGGLVG